MQVIAGNVSKSADDWRTLEQFLFIWLITLFIPRALHVIPIHELATLAEGVYYIATTIIALRLIPNVARTVATMIISITKYSSRQIGPSIHMGGVTAQNVVIGDTIPSVPAHPTPSKSPSPPLESDNSPST